MYCCGGRFANYVTIGSSLARSLRGCWGGVVWGGVHRHRYRQSMLGEGGQGREVILGNVLNPLQLFNDPWACSTSRYPSNKQYTPCQIIF